MIGVASLLNRRQAIGFGLAVPFAACAAPVATSVLLPQFRETHDVDDSAALVRAFATGRPVRAPAGGGSGPAGRYLIANDAAAVLPGGAALSGEGMGRTIFARSYRQDKPFLLHCDSRSADPARNIAGLRFADLTFEDEVATRGFSEYNYMVMLNGITDAAFERVEFRGFRGDGLHLGSSVTSSTERHNRKVLVRNCLFEGVNANNRNGISVIDCAGLIIEHSQFLNCSRPGNGGATPEDPRNPRTGAAMPGAIDLEPNADAFAIIRDVAIRNNVFRGGGGYAVALNLRPNDTLREAQSRIVIEDNVIEDRNGGVTATGFAGTTAATSQRSYEIAMRRNQVRRCAKPFLVDGIRGMAISANKFEDCTGAAELGYASTTANVRVTANEFVRVGSAVVPYGLWVRAAVGAVVSNNLFDDCGAEGSSNGIAVGFVGGVQRELQFRANRFRASTGRMEQAVTVFRDASIDRATLRIGENDLRLPRSGFLQSFGVSR